MLRFRFTIASFYIIFITSLGIPAFAAPRESSKCYFRQKSESSANNPNFQGSSKILSVKGYSRAVLDALTKARQELDREYPGLGYLDTTNPLNCRIVDKHIELVDGTRVLQVTIELIPQPIPEEECVEGGQCPGYIACYMRRCS